ncbi:MAG: FAD-dependent oxidoreductase [Lentisphaerae bacterium]|jgi:hypothetical protein|nr:FAD-dependent oxidoreductase [Lentisphaerota bacterium]MBT5609133.1 FAD-dependent oxidoreductase [Lentisphaerota bacterium]MBT7058424.1 FAD-dependent oxidoreductase [Lentisphaerota bacterium]MBT7840358.1 FAD-dependent oxidoreductase [Lentisphaerota bacterium]
MDRRRFIGLGVTASVAPTGVVAVEKAGDSGKGKGAKAVFEPSHEIPVVGEAQVAVVGGGIAGVAAALAARRLGADVWLIERESLPGGLATLGNVVIYLPLCDGYGNQVSGGLCEELVRLSVRHNTAAIPERWRTKGETAGDNSSRFRVTFNPWDFALNMEEILVREGVHILYCTSFCDVLSNGDRVEHLIIENKGGRQAIRVGAVVDASGDADVCARAGAPTVALDTNVRAGWFFVWDGKRNRPIMLSKPFSSSGARMKNDSAAFTGIDGEAVTQQLLGTRQMQREKLRQLREKNARVEPINLNTVPDFRMTRRLRGVVTLREKDVGQWPEDTVGMFANWRTRGPVYPVPFRSLYTRDVANLITAGRCMSSEGTAWDQARAIPACAVTGEAAGVAAAMLTKGGIAQFASLPVSQLQSALTRRGAILDQTLMVQVNRRQSKKDKTAVPGAH